MNLYNQHADQLNTVMNTRGYRGHFENHVAGTPPMRFGALLPALQTLRERFIQGPNGGFTAEVWTDVPYSDIRTGFKLAYDPAKGFKVTEQHISVKGQQPKVMRLRSHQEIFGFRAVIMMSPKRREPWEEMLRGRPFRPGH